MSKSSKSPKAKLFNIDKFADKFYPKDRVVNPVDHGLREYSVKRSYIPMGAPIIEREDTREGFVPFFNIFRQVA